MPSPEWKATRGLEAMKKADPYRMTSKRDAVPSFVMPEASACDCSLKTAAIRLA